MDCDYLNIALRVVQLSDKTLLTDCGEVMGGVAPCNDGDTRLAATYL